MVSKKNPGKRKKANHVPFVFPFVNASSAASDWEASFDGFVPSASHSPQHDDQSSTSAEHNLNPEDLQLKPYDDNDYIPDDEKDWMKSQLKRNICSIQSTSAWNPPSDFDLSTFKLRSIKIGKERSPRRTHVEEETFRINYSSIEPQLDCFGNMVFMKDCDGNRRPMNSQFIEQTKERIRERVENAVEVFKQELSTVDSEFMKKLLAEIYYLRDACSHPLGPSMAKLATIGLQETQSEGPTPLKRSCFIDWAIGYNDIRLCRVQAADPNNWKEEIETEIKRVTKHSDIRSNLQRERFEMAVPKHNFKVCIGTDFEELMQLQTTRLLHSLGREREDATSTMVTYLDPNQTRSKLSQLATDKGIEAFPCPKELIMGDYCVQSLATEHVNIRLRWQKQPPRRYFFVTVKDPAFLRFANDVFIFHSVAAEITFRKRGAKQLKVFHPPGGIRNQPEALEWVRTLLIPQGIEVEDVKVPLHDRQELDLETQNSLSLVLTEHFIKLFQDELEKFNKNPFGETYEMGITKWIRVCDDKSGTLNTDRIAVCGWPKSYVDSGFAYIRRLFEPKIIHAQTKDEQWLFYGIGAAWLRQKLQAEKETNNLFYDVDATRRRITLWGSETKREDLAFGIHVGINNRLSMEVGAAVSIAPPRFPRNFELVVNHMDWTYGTENVSGFANLLKGDAAPRIDFKKETKSILVRGNVAQYEQLLHLLEGLDQAVYAHFRSLVEDPSFLSMSSRPICGICLGPLSDDFYCLELCGHIFCRECINGQVLHGQHSRDRMPFVCASENCEKPFAASDIKRLLLGAGGGFTLADRAWWWDSEKLKVFVRAALDQLLSRPGAMYFSCLTPDCQGLFEKKKAPPGLPCNGTNKCGSCGRVHCLFCGIEEHQFISCDQYKELREDADVSLKKYMDQLGRTKITPCPQQGCSVVIEKTAGCNHMQCAKCKVHFCWICKHIGKNEGGIYKHLTEAHGGAQDDPWRFDEGGNLIGVPEGEEEAFLHNLIALQQG
ncbi:unnamed protein product, partial [Mesorhabditis belari]|uniref:RBR-type E3 ubiquitin transferase n=1 Tax=Mesorhabditis belari TaxID=2138241 RepID=A0AAF3FFW4_9BILA